MVHTEQQWKVRVQDHPGSTADDIFNEPDWEYGHDHQIGALNRDNRRAGHTHAGDENDDQQDSVSAPKNERPAKNQKTGKSEEGQLLNFRDIVVAQPDLHLQHPENRSVAWRYVLDTSEDWVKNVQDWPANKEKRRTEEEHKKEQGDENGADKTRSSNANSQQRQNEEPQPEHEWNNHGNGSKHHDAYAANDEEHADGNAKPKEDKSKEDELREKYTAQELSLLKMLEGEKEHVQSLKQNDGKQSAPKQHDITTSIDEADQFTPDNWIPRSPDLMRLTGKHPLNAEPNLNALFDAGFITPNDLHYVRSHGAVPRLLRESHSLDVQHGKVVLSMDDIKKFDYVNIPAAMACSGTRRKELNMIKKSKGFNFGPGSIGCAYWKGPLVRNVLRVAGVAEDAQGGKDYRSTRYWVHFEGADTPNDIPYETSIPLEYVMDATSDIILAYEMNDLPLPPDHGYPVRLVVPGYIGGRSVKWLRRIWIDDKESDNYWHVYENRALPSFITEMDGEFAEVMMRHPDTACYEQNLNSVIVKPAQDERVGFSDARKTYRVEGFAYDGGGHEVQKVEISLDGGNTWLYCRRKFPDRPIRHGNKFWTWIFWYVDINILQLLRAPSVIVRCFNVFKNTQPQTPAWNLLGSLNNSWYEIRPEAATLPDSNTPCILFRHPVEPGNASGGWMQPSWENKIEAVKQQAGTPQKQFTKDEIEKHNNKKDCWLVVDNKVYDATSVLEWHPGGAAALLGHAGKVHYQTTDEFSSIHDAFAYKKLKECILGVVTDKAKKFIQQSKEAAEKEAPNAPQHDKTIALQKHRWVPCKLRDRKSISEDTNVYTFALPDGYKKLGMSSCQHVQIGFHLKDRMVIRPYTPTRPLLPAKDEDDSPCNDLLQANADSLRDGVGSFDLIVKTYLPTDSQPGGALTNILDCVPIGEEVEIRGPTGDIVYHGNGEFDIEGKQREYKQVSMVLGGSGLTPGYSLIARVLLTQSDRTELRVIDANNSEEDILLRDELQEFEEKYPDQFKIMHVLSHPSDTWKGKKGHVNEEIIQENLFKPGKDSVLFLCGPPTMINKAVMPVVTKMGYKEHENCFGF